MIGRCLTPEMICPLMTCVFLQGPPRLHRHSLTLHQIKDGLSFTGLRGTAIGAALSCPHWPRQLSLHEYDALCLIANVV